MAVADPTAASQPLRAGLPRPPLLFQVARVWRGAEPDRGGGDRLPAMRAVQLRRPPASRPPFPLGLPLRSFPPLEARWPPPEGARLTHCTPLRADYLPERVGPYVLSGRLLGEGGTGNVYHGWCSQTRVEVAIKRLHRTTSHRRAVCSAPRHQRIRLSAGTPPRARCRPPPELEPLRIVAAAGHPNLCAFLDHRSVDGVDYIVMEYCSGGELFALIDKDSILPEAEAAAIARGAVGGLAFMHRQGVCHRDLKLENILLDRPNGRAKVTPSPPTPPHHPHHSHRRRSREPTRAPPHFVADLRLWPRARLWPRRVRPAHLPLPASAVRHTILHGARGDRGGWLLLRRIHRRRLVARRLHLCNGVGVLSSRGASSEKPEIQPLAHSQRRSCDALSRQLSVAPRGHTSTPRPHPCPQVAHEKDWRFSRLVAAQLAGFSTVPSRRPTACEPDELVTRYLGVFRCTPSSPSTSESAISRPHSSRCWMACCSSIRYGGCSCTRWNRALGWRGPHRYGRRPASQPLTMAAGTRASLPRRSRLRCG